MLWSEIFHCKNEPCGITCEKIIEKETRDEFHQCPECNLYSLKRMPFGNPMNKMLVDGQHRKDYRHTINKFRLQETAEKEAARGNKQAAWEAKKELTKLRIQDGTYKL